ncbi:MAG: hypothetical protein OEX07_08335, partial [Gammaproteobacteria bacterium]|nr:hypothetical protein [Gammaproteobacteria bacterium]
MMYLTQGLYQVKRLLVLTLIFTTIMMSGCFFNDDSDSSSLEISQRLETRVVTAKGTITKAQVNLYQLDGRGLPVAGSLIQTNSDEQGVWSATGVASDKYYLVEMTSGNYYDNSDSETDLLKKRNILLAADQKIFSILAPGKTTVSVNLITHMLANQVMQQLQNSGGFVETFTRQSVKASNVFGFDPFSFTTDNEPGYKLYLGGYELLLNSMAISMDKPAFDYDILALFTEDYLDCNIDNAVNGTDIVNSLTLPTTFLFSNELTRFRNNNFRLYQSVNANLAVNEADLCDETVLTQNNVDYASAGIDGNYDLVAVETTQDGASSNVSVTANFDRTRLPGGAMTFSIKKNYNTAIGEYDDELGIQTTAITSGAELLNTGFTAFYRTGQLVYASADAVNSGTLNIQTFAQSGGRFIISYYFSLCLESSDCSVASNVRYFYGDIVVTRDADIAFQSSGTLLTPVNLGAINYSSVLLGDKQRISSAASSYYSVSLSGNSIYDVSLLNADGKIDLSIYSDSAYSQLLCAVNNVAALYRSCAGYVAAATTLFIRLDYADLFEGANFDLSVSSGQVSLSANGAMENYYNHVDVPSGPDHATITSIIDHTVQPDKRTNVSFQSDFDTASSTYLNALTFSFDAADSTGSFTLGGNASASFVSNGVVYSDADPSVNGNVIIDYYGLSGDVVRGSYTFLLCEVNKDCSVVANQISLAGRFVVARDTTIPFIQEGDIATPVDLLSIPYAGVSGGTLHSVIAGTSSYYSISSQTFTNYIFELNSLSDNVALYVYSDAGFTTLLCSSDQAALTSERCALQTSTETTLYVRVDYLGMGEGAFYDLNVSTNVVTLSENGNPLNTFYETTQTGLNTDRLMSARYNHTASGGAKTEIVLLKNYNTGTSVYDDTLLLTFDGLDSTGTYNINIDASAKYTTASTNYIVDGTNSSGSIIVDQYDPVGGVIHGTYNIILCIENQDCTNSVNQYSVDGSFSIVREADTVFVSEGDLVVPYILGTAPYDSVSVLTTGQRHLVDSGMMSSYYSIAVDLNSQYQITAANPSDNIALYVFSDSNFSMQLCYIDQIGLMSE